MLSSANGVNDANLQEIDRVASAMPGHENFVAHFFKPFDSAFFEGTSGDIDRSWLVPAVEQKEIAALLPLFFPGRSGGSCDIYDVKTNKLSACEVKAPDDKQNLTMIPTSPTDTKLVRAYQDEFASILNIPAAGFYTDQKFPYLIDEDTAAVYFKGNFEGELGSIPFTGNLGARYVRTKAETTGVLTQRPVDPYNAPYKDKADEVIQVYTPVFSEHTYNNLLPSANINFNLMDDMYLRLAASKSMTRANPEDLSPSRNVFPGASDGSRGNPYLNPMEATAFDISWEWYFTKNTVFSAALFQKNLENYIDKDYFTEISDQDRDKNGLFDDPLTISQPQNGDDGRVKGFEIAATHSLDWINNWMSGFGFQANYTLTDSSQNSGFSDLDGSQLPVRDLSENSYNFVFFYDKYGFNFRAAYNYRDEAFKGFATPNPDTVLWLKNENLLPGIQDYSRYAARLPIWSDEFSTLDISASYKYEGFTLFLQATNVLSEPVREYVGSKEETKNLLKLYRDTGSLYSLGVRYTF